jgi:NADH-quinone oxidoreductase subunit N
MLLTNLKQEYLYLTVFIVLSFILSIFLLLLSYAVSYKKKNDIEKLSAYECGFDPFGSGGSSFEVHFYIVGILFIIFDLEIIFLYPWAHQFKVLGGSGFYGAMVFLIILTVGFIYEWRKGALDWTKSAVIKKVLNKKSALLVVAAEGTSPRANLMIGGEDKDIQEAFAALNKDIQEAVAALKVVLLKFWYGPWDWSSDPNPKPPEDPFVAYLRETFIVLLQAMFLVLFRATVEVLAPIYVLYICYAHYFGDTILLVAIFTLLIFAATKQAFGINWTYVEKYEAVLKGLKFVMVAMLFMHFFFLSVSGQDLVTIHHQHHYLVSDYYTTSAQVYLEACTILFFILTSDYLIMYSVKRQIDLVEFPLITAFALYFMLLLVCSFNLFGAYVSLEGVTFSLYILAGMNYNSQNSLEAGMKYFCLGALSSGFLLFGIALTFIITKTLDFGELRFLFEQTDELPLLLSFALIFIFFGFWFKLSIFPCHAWTPDVYEGVLTPVTFFFATVVKLSVFMFFARVLFFLLGSKSFLLFWQPFFLFVAAGSIILGALGALLQTKIKRFIGYTSINQMGYLFIGISSGDLLGLQASFLYLFFYMIMVFSFFSILLYVNDINTGREVLFINQLRQFGLQHRNLSCILGLILFSMAGIPPLGGFFGKFFLFFSAFSAGNHSLVFLGLGMNAISAFYYLRIIKCLFFTWDLAGTGQETFFSESREPKYSFFLGAEVFSSMIFDAILFFFLISLLIAPFFLSGLLHYFGVWAVSASYVGI